MKNILIASFLFATTLSINSMDYSKDVEYLRQATPEGYNLIKAGHFDWHYKIYFAIYKPDQDAVEYKKYCEDLEEFNNAIKQGDYSARKPVYPIKVTSGAQNELSFGEVTKYTEARDASLEIETKEGKNFYFPGLPGNGKATINECSSLIEYNLM